MTLENFQKQTANHLEIQPLTSEYVTDARLGGQETAALHQSKGKVEDYGFPTVSIEDTSQKSHHEGHNTEAIEAGHHSHKTRQRKGHDAADEQARKDCPPGLTYFGKDKWGRETYCDQYGNEVTRTVNGGWHKEMTGDGYRERGAYEETYPDGTHVIGDQYGKVVIDGKGTITVRDFQGGVTTIPSR